MAGALPRAVSVLAVLLVVAVTVYLSFASVEPLKGGYWTLSLLFMVAGWAIAWALGWVIDLVMTGAKAPPRLTSLLVPALFGVVVIVAWEYYVAGSKIPLVLLPAPSQIWEKLVNSIPTIAADFRQTFIRAVIPGWLIGCLSGFARGPAVRPGGFPAGADCCRLEIWWRRCRSSAWPRSWSCGSASTGSRRPPWLSS